MRSPADGWGAPRATATAVDERLREASRLVGSLRLEDRLQTKITLSGAR